MIWWEGPQKTTWACQRGKFLWTQIIEHEDERGYEHRAAVWCRTTSQTTINWQRRTVQPIQRSSNTQTNGSPSTTEREKLENEAVEVLNKEESMFANIRLGERWSNGIGLIKWDQMTQRYISQTTFRQSTLGGHHTDMLLNDATFRQEVFQITCRNILVSSLL